MSRKAQCRNAFVRYTAKVYRQDEPYGICAVCGEYIYWPEEDIAWDEHQQLCHAACVEKEDTKWQ